MNYYTCVLAVHFSVADGTELDFEKETTLPFVPFVGLVLDGPFKGALSSPLCAPEVAVGVTEVMWCPSRSVFWVELQHGQLEAPERDRVRRLFHEHQWSEGFYSVWNRRKSAPSLVDRVAILEDAARKARRIVSTIDDISPAHRFPDGMHTESLGVGGGWAVETYPAADMGYWFRIVRVDHPSVGCPRRAVAEKVARAAAARLQEGS